MTGKFSIEVVARSRPGHGAADFALVPAREELPHAGEADFSNVVPFVRPRVSDAARTAPEIVLPADAVRRPARTAGQRVRQGLALALSLAIHGGLLTLLWHEPPPLASIGLEVISVELVLGATAPAGVATAPGENEVQSAAVPEKAIAPEQTEQVEQKATEQPQKVAVAEKETAPEVKTARAEEPKQFETAAAPERAQSRTEAAGRDGREPGRRHRNRGAARGRARSGRNHAASSARGKAGREEARGQA